MDEPYFPEYSITDERGALEYIKHKLPDWHKRLGRLEICNEAQVADLNTIKAQIGEIHTAVVGSNDGQKRGLLTRMVMLESFRLTLCWAVGVLYVALVSAVITIIVKALHDKI